MMLLVHVNVLVSSEMDELNSLGLDIANNYQQIKKM
jgi:hypothetical protein